MSFDHTAAAAQLASCHDYVAQSYSFGAVSFGAVAEDVPAEFAVDSAGVERKLIVQRSALAALPREGDLITAPDAASWRLIRTEPGPTANFITLRIGAALR